MKITVLIENTAKEGFCCEHGLSLLIEHSGRRILLDAGNTGKFAENADKLGISLASVDMAVLSHGHYDHSGGFADFFATNRTAEVWARQEITGKYLSGSGGSMHGIGVPEEVLAQMGRFRLVSKNTALADDIFLIGHSTPSLGGIGERTALYKEQNGTAVPDDFAHEQSLVIETERGLVIFNSCSHGGAANIMREAREACRKPVFAYIGGLHMKGKDPIGQDICAFTDEEVDDLCKAFLTENVRRVYTGHCTGSAGFEELRKRLGDRVTALTSGQTFEL